MSRKEAESKFTGSESRLEVVGRDDNGDFIVKHHPPGNISRICDTFAEMFPIVETSPANSTPFFYDFIYQCALKF